MVHCTSSNHSTKQNGDRTDGLSKEEEIADQHTHATMESIKRDKKALDLWTCARSLTELQSLARLLQDSTPPDDRNDLGETALHVAASRGNDEAVVILLQYGADLLAVDWESGWTPLHRSLYHEHLSTSLLLLRHAQRHFGKKFVHKYLYETFDHAHQSPMQLLSSSLHDKEREVIANDGGLVYTFGKRDYQLGYYVSNTDLQVTPRLVEFPSHVPIIQLSASKYHTIALNAAGECFVWGFGKSGRLGTGDEFDRIEPTRLASLETRPIKNVAAGENHTLVLTQTGQVYSWGSNSFGQLGHPKKANSSSSRFTPKRIDAFRLNTIAAIAASGCHSAAISANDAAVYTWGSNRRGQLGRKEGCGTDQSHAMPRVVDALLHRHTMCVVYGNYDSVRAEKIALSDWHTCVIIRCSHNGKSLGQVWQFGYGSYRPSRVSFPSTISANLAGAVMSDTWVPRCKQRGIDIIEVSCAQNHSIALDATGSVFTWGYNVPALSHQLSSSRYNRETTKEVTVTSVSSPSAPQKVSLSGYGPVNSVCASQDHCAVVTQHGDLVTWGCGRQGVLGHGRGNSWQPSPKRVAGVKKAIAVAAGHQHTAVLVAPVNPNFDMISPSSEQVMSSLVELSEREIAAHVNVINCAQVWYYAERYAAFRLQSYCVEYMRKNWDAVLDAQGRDRMQILFDIMLPPLVEEPEPEKQNTIAINVAKLEEKKGVKASLAAKKSSDNRSVLLSTAAQKGEPSDHLELSTRSEGALVKSLDRSRKGKSTKFVSVSSFLSAENASVSTRDACDPWGLRAVSHHVKPSTASSNLVSQSSMIDGFPGLRSSHDNAIQRQRKSSIGSSSPRLSLSPAKDLMNGDDVDRGQLTEFPLDAFLKKTTRRRTGDKKRQVSVPAWTSTALTVNTQEKRSLRQIQEEEAAAAAQKRNVRASLGGNCMQRSQSTVNSWGLCPPPEHISLTDVQKLQEEQAFIEQQHQILAEIDAMKAQKVSKTEHRRMVSRRARDRKQATENVPGSERSDAKAGGSGKRNKQKKSKERKQQGKGAK